MVLGIAQAVLLGIPDGAERVSDVVPRIAMILAAALTVLAGLTGYRPVATVAQVGQLSAFAVVICVLVLWLGYFGEVEGPISLFASLVLLLVTRGAVHVVLPLIVILVALHLLKNSVSKQDRADDTGTVFDVSSRRSQTTSRRIRIIRAGLVVLALVGPAWAGITYLDESLAVDRCLDMGGSFDYGTMTCDYHQNCPFVPFSVRHPGLLAGVGLCFVTGGLGFASTFAGTMRRRVGPSAAS
jgi:hypothetical protein